MTMLRSCTSLAILGSMSVATIGHAAPIPRAPQCTTLATIPHPGTSESVRSPSVYGERVVYARDQLGWTGADVCVWDAATATSVCLPNAGSVGWGSDPVLADENTVVYRRAASFGTPTELRAHWFGSDGIPVTADDVDWTFDADWGLGPHHAAFSEVAYIVTDAVAGTYEVRRCDLYLGSATPCIAGFVASLVPSVPTDYPHEAFPIVGGGVAWGTTTPGVATNLIYWDPVGGELPWSSHTFGEHIRDAAGPLVTVHRSWWTNTTLFLTVAPVFPYPMLFTASAPWTWIDDSAIARNAGSDNRVKVVRSESGGGTSSSRVFVSSWGSSSTTVQAGPPAIVPRGWGVDVAIDGDIVAYDVDAGIGIDRCTIP